MNKYQSIYLQALFIEGMHINTREGWRKASGFVDTSAEPPIIRFTIKTYKKPLQRPALTSTYNSLVECLEAMEAIAPIEHWKPIMDDDDEDEPDPDDPNDPRNYEEWPK